MGFRVKFLLFFAHRSRLRGLTTSCTLMYFFAGPPHAPRQPQEQCPSSPGPPQAWPLRAGQLWGRTPSLSWVRGQRLAELTESTVGLRNALLEKRKCAVSKTSVSHRRNARRPKTRLLASMRCLFLHPSCAESAPAERPVLFILYSFQTCFSNPELFLIECWGYLGQGVG